MKKTFLDMRLTLRILLCSTNTLFEMKRVKHLITGLPKRRNLPSETQDFRFHFPWYDKVTQIILFFFFVTRPTLTQWRVDTARSDSASLNTYSERNESSDTFSTSFTNNSLILDLTVFHVKLVQLVSLASSLIFFICLNFLLTETLAFINALQSLSCM